MKRCEWAESEPMQGYHDEVWGMPVHDDRTLFEFLILEGAQAGLSWATILKRKDTYNKAFDNFDVIKVANYTEKDYERLMQDPGVIRNKLKIRAAIKSAQLILEIQKEFGSLDKYLWKFVNNKPLDGKIRAMKEIEATTKESDALSKDLKKRGFTFVGSTICYAFMQATGMVNDHEVTCLQYEVCKKS
ncbi:MAG: DNA-3-methyladenine glycosylase I [Nanoarchaeota archaeon]|nr:DNA-3-methyladenine glycosylase I [Nanoarchaeota archaeon]